MKSCASSGRPSGRRVRRACAWTVRSRPTRCSCRAIWRRYDAVLAMYHDQGLPVLKHAGFGHAVNVTLGLPIVRTSVDHGTALDLAGTGRADAGSLVAAIELAAHMAARQGDRLSSLYGRARKRFGQHFLHDPAVLCAHRRRHRPQAGDAAVEIGPGRGALTAAIARRCRSAGCDRDRSRPRGHPARRVTPIEPRFVLHQTDALTVDWQRPGNPAAARACE